METIKADGTKLKLSQLLASNDKTNPEDDEFQVKKPKEDLNLQEHCKAGDNNALTVTAYNPTIPDEEEDSEILETMRGDAIGNTLYSSRFVINTLMKLRDIKEPLENDEGLEKELESLWDMTIEKDVVLLLLQFDVFEIFIQCMLKYSNDGRLIEILVGIMGNMCSVTEEAMEQLCKLEAAIDVLASLISTDDSGVLIQLMRLYTNAFSKESSAYIWNTQIIKSGDFIDCFCFILSNSCNTSLLLHSFETLNAILAKSAIMTDPMANNDIAENEKQEVPHKDYLHYFLSLKLSESIKQGFLTFHAKETVYTSRCDEDDDEEANEEFNESISESVQKAFIIFLNIQEIIFNYAYDDIWQAETDTDLKACLLIIISTISTPIFVLPNNFGYLLSVLEIFKGFFSASCSLHDENMASYIANMWEILRKLKLRQTSGVTNNGFDDDNDNVLDEAINESLNKLFQLTQDILKIMLQNYDINTLEIILRRLSPLAAFKLLEAFGIPLSTDFTEEHHITTLHCSQLQSVLNP